MLVASGSTAAGFCVWVRMLGETAEELVEGLPVGVELLHLEARDLLATGQGARLRQTLDTARAQGALISIDLGPVGWIRAHGSSKTAYQLATIQPDVLFAAEDSSAELGAPLEGMAAVPVVLLGARGCSVYGRHLVAPAQGELDPDGLQATFCVALVEGAAPVEAAGRAILATRGFSVAGGRLR